MYKYKVLWFDDEFETLELIKESAGINDIELIGFSNAKEGIEELNRNYSKYDAVLIDGLFFIDNQQAAVPTSDKALFEVAVALQVLAPIKKFPWFILSGQLSFTKEKNRYADGLRDNKVYDKLNNDHLETLWNDIKSEANSQLETQLKQKYHNIIQVTYNYLGEVQFSRLLGIIKHIENIEDFESISDKLNMIRKLLEAIFIKLGEISIIPEKIIKSNGWINGSSLFLSNKHSDFQHNINFIHPVISENIFRLLLITQDGSHAEGNLKLRVDEYLSNSNSDYYYRSCVFLLFDLIEWFGVFVSAHPNQIENKELWREVPLNIEGSWIPGKITRIAENGFGTFRPENSGATLSILPQMVKEFNLSESQFIEVITKTDGTKKLIINIRLI